MYICPTCNKEFLTEEKVVKHYLSCWKEKHPNCNSNPAHRSEDITTRKVNDDITDFFNSFSKGE